jgi:hypothetical protein
MSAWSRWGVPETIGDRPHVDPSGEELGGNEVAQVVAFSRSMSHHRTVHTSPSRAPVAAAVITLS